MRINVLTIFPDYLEGPLGLSIPGRAREAGLVDYRLIDVRAYATDRHRTTDDEPFGGGGGMVMKPEPFDAALKALDRPGRVISLSPRGRPFDHATAVRFALESDLTLLCGRYKGIDERVVDARVDEEISIGDYVLSGGEPAALVVIDAVVRLLPGALGDHDSASSDSFYDGSLSAPSYTRPAEHGDQHVPDVLRSGDHPRIERWRAAQADAATRRRRPDLLDLDAAD
ncbi:tRNA (guanosine(37)-N1)-methyltransferase TrmD [Candidatus Palauibacter sp.]|uniref:tRNA (guanosine(37)-N1)-methyltransferase TrmD n=1 Tax=Candidatus Palauibacter sp. TaxID=3101350 RepID=UPI003B5BD39D